MDYDPRPGINATLAAMKAEKEQLQQQLSAEISRLREAKRMAGLIADQRSLENVALRTENDRLRAALRVNALRERPYMSHAEVDEEIDRIVRGDEQGGSKDD